MEEMVYQADKQKIMKPIILDHDYYLGFEYVILSLHTHPCAYLCLTGDSKLYGMEFKDINKKYKLGCHWGLSYSGDYLVCDDKGSIINKNEGKWVIGWDYNHYGDYNANDPNLLDKQWTTAEIRSEIEQVIEQLISYEIR